MGNTMEAVTSVWTDPNVMVIAADDNVANVSKRIDDTNTGNIKEPRRIAPVLLGKIDFATT